MTKFKPAAILQVFDAFVEEEVRNEIKFHEEFGGEYNGYNDFMMKSAVMKFIEKNPDLAKVVKTWVKKHSRQIVRNGVPSNELKGWFGILTWIGFGCPNPKALFGFKSTCPTYIF